ncbi:MAG: hypothetical protein M3292_07285 [Actinomycetota bacterium]|nr:hypothetical protein [Actinomycetota bacterium]
MTERPEVKAVDAYVDAYARSSGFKGTELDQVKEEMRESLLAGEPLDDRFYVDRGPQRVSDQDLLAARPDLTQADIDFVRSHYAVFHVTYADEERPLQTFSSSNREEAFGCADDLAKLDKSKGRRICVVQSVLGMEETIHELEA